METPNLTKLLEEVVRLEKRSELLDFLLGYYDVETKTFVIPEKWKNSNVREDKLPAKTPRNFVLKKILALLSEEEVDEHNFFADMYAHDIDRYNL